MKVLYIGDFIKGNGPSTVDINVRNSIEKSNPNNQVEFLQSTTKISISVLRKIHNVDVVHVSGVSFLGVILMLFSRLCRKKTSMTMHGSLVMESRFRKIALYRRIFELVQQKCANNIMPVSNLLAGKIKTKKKVIVIPNGVNFIDKPTILKQNNLITLIGGGRKEKRHLEVCEVIKKINDEYDLNIKVNLFGEHGIDSNKINSFSFVKDFGFCNKDVVFESLLKSKIFIQYSEFESFSLAVADAINYQCYIITSNCVGINDFISKSNSYIVADNKKKLEEAIIQQYNDKERTMIENKLLTWEQVSDKYVKCWETL